MCGTDPGIWTAQCCPGSKHKAIRLPLVTGVPLWSGHSSWWKLTVVRIGLKPHRLLIVIAGLAFQGDLLFRVPSQEGQRIVHCAIGGQGVNE